MQYPQNITKPVKIIEMTIKYRNLFLCNVNSHKELKKWSTVYKKSLFYYRTVRSNKKKQSSTAKGKQQLLLHLKRGEIFL